MSDPRVLPPMSVEFYPNTGQEVGWCIALERELERRGWMVEYEVMFPSGRRVDILARHGRTVWLIEVKANPAGPAAVAQLQNYMDEAEPIYPNAIGVLAAPRLTCTVRGLPNRMYFLPLVRA